jgi:hypothetical protein
LQKRLLMPSYLVAMLTLEHHALLAIGLGLRLGTWSGQPGWRFLRGRRVRLGVSCARRLSIMTGS